MSTSALNVFEGLSDDGPCRAYKEELSADARSVPLGRSEEAHALVLPAFVLGSALAKCAITPKRFRPKQQELHQAPIGQLPIQPSPARSFGSLNAPGWALSYRDFTSMRCGFACSTLGSTSITTPSRISALILS